MKNLSKKLLGIGIALYLVAWAFLVIVEGPFHLHQALEPHNVAIFLALALPGALLIGIGLGILSGIRHKI